MTPQSTSRDITALCAKRTPIAIAWNPYQKTQTAGLVKFNDNSSLQENVHLKLGECGSYQRNCSFILVNNGVSLLAS